MAYMRRTKLVLCMFRNMKLAMDLFEKEYTPSRDEQAYPLEEGDYVKKVSGDYHIHGYIACVFYTYYLHRLRYVVEHKAEGGGYFCHIYSHSNLKLISKAQKREW